MPDKVHGRCRTTSFERLNGLEWSILTSVVNLCFRILSTDYYRSGRWLVNDRITVDYVNAHNRSLGPKIIDNVNNRFIIEFRVWLAAKKQYSWIKPENVLYTKCMFVSDKKS